MDDENNCILSIEKNFRGGSRLVWPLHGIVDGEGPLPVHLALGSLPDLGLQGANGRLRESV